MNKNIIVIFSGRFTGAFTAKHLQRLKLDNTVVELISNTNYYVFPPLLPKVTSGTLRAADAFTPLRLNIFIL